MCNTNKIPINYFKNHGLNNIRDNMGNYYDYLHDEQSDKSVLINESLDNTKDNLSDIYLYCSHNTFY